jgi:5-methylthioadenosine/S-adenosylhomocysteine deaminase
MPSPTDAGGTPSGDAVDRFEAAYTEGVHYEPAPAVARPQDTRRELLLREAPAEAVALAGCVLTPDRAIEKGYVVVGAGKQIQAVTEQRPQGVQVHETGGVITPGLIDLHGHPEFNIFAAWEPPQQFINRYAWRGSGLYKQLVREPQNKLLTALPAQTQLRYAEIRALVGGVTAIQGTGGAATAYQDESLVRNVDKWIFGSQVARAMIDLPTATSRDMERLNKILDEIAHDQIKAFYLHLCEGRTDNQRSQDEFERFIELKALTPSTVVIHGTSLTREQVGQLKDGGAKLVWSPQSNLRLYGETTRAGEALELGMLVGLGADWLPSGSTSLLSEIKVARRSLVEQGHTPTSKRLLAMVTSDAAKIAGLEDKLGKLASGRPADLCVFERRIENPWDNVVEADPSWVELVMIDGDLTYGRADWLGQLAASDDRDRFEPLIAWGKPMLLDASYTAAGAGGGEQTKLAQLRAALIKEYPQVGPILA